MAASLLSDFLKPAVETRNGTGLTATWVDQPSKQQAHDGSHTLQVIFVGTSCMTEPVQDVSKGMVSALDMMHCQQGH